MSEKSNDILDTFKIKNGNSDKLQIVFTINGVQVSFMSVVKRIHDEHDRIIKNAAKELLREKFCSLSDAINDLKLDIEQELDL